MGKKTDRREFLKISAAAGTLALGGLSARPSLGQTSKTLTVAWDSDIDSLDPAEAPGTGTPEAGGIRVIEALRLLRGLRGLDFVGGDLVEVAPSWDNGTITSFNGASILFEILCLVTEARVARSK